MKETNRKVKYSFPKKVKEKILNEIVMGAIDINNKIRAINYGGCGAFAEALYDKFELLGFNPQIVVFVFSVEKFKDSMNMLDEHGMEYYEDNRTEGFPHILVKVDKYYIDSTGAEIDYRNIPSYWDDYKVYHGMDIEKLRMCNKVHSLWNSNFRRSNIRTINSRLNKIYKKIVTEYLEVSK